jgi:hypothetical protein
VSGAFFPFTATPDFFLPFPDPSRSSQSLFPSLAVLPGYKNGAAPPSAIHLALLQFLWWPRARSPRARVPPPPSRANHRSSAVLRSSFRVG